MRGFVDKGQGFDGKPHNIWIEADDDRAREARDLRRLGVRARARRSMSSPARSPSSGQARAADVLQMQTIVVDLDAGDIAPSSTTSSATSARPP